MKTAFEWSHSRRRLCGGHKGTEEGGPLVPAPPLLVLHRIELKLHVPLLLSPVAAPQEPTCLPRPCLISPQALGAFPPAAPLS